MDESLLMQYLSQMENRLAASQRATEARLTAAQAATKRDLQKAQLASEFRLIAAQAALKEDLLTSRKEFQEDFKKAGDRMVGRVANATILRVVGLMVFTSGLATLYPYAAPQIPAIIHHFNLIF